MKIYCLGDLHLSGSPPQKPMDIFGEEWRNHPEKIKSNWQKIIKDEDLVIVCGDISWGMTIKKAAVDLEWLAALPGRKLLCRGNHDYWWSSVTKLRSQFPNLTFIQNDYVLLGDLAICASRGWKVPSNPEFKPEDEKIYLRELVRLGLGLDAAMKAGAKEILVALHFPPVFHAEESNGYTELFSKYPIHQVVFGHIHGEKNIAVFEGEKEGISYKLCSADTQGFTPVFIRDYLTKKSDECIM